MQNEYSNPYEVTAAQIYPAESADAESIRKKYISHEASVKSMGTLYFLGSCLLLLLAVTYFGMAIYAMSRPDQVEAAAILGIMSVFCGLFGAAQLAMSIGLWRLRPWARIVATIFAAFGLLGIPIGTLISIYFLYLLHSEKGAMVFSDGYKTIIQQTPHVKYRTSAIAWAALILFILFIIVMIVLAVPEPDN